MRTDSDSIDDSFDAPDAVEELMAECLALPEGERVRAIDERCRARPELAEELRRRFAVLDAAGLSAIDGDFPERLGDFRLIRRLGAGGMGVVFLAEQTSLGRSVALKLVRPEHLYFAGARERFRREVEAIAKLNHPGIVPIYTVGEERGVPYFAMELIAGATLAEIISALRGREPDELTGADFARTLEALTGSRVEPSAFRASWNDTAVELARQIAVALDHAHSRGILHRDVKPSNIAVTVSGRAMLLDFGLTSSADAARITQSGAQLGTLHYMSPEQVAGRTVDARTDVYALGVSLYELLSMRLPFDGPNNVAIESAITDGRASPIRSRNRRVSVDAEIVCATAMDPEAARRYAGAAEFARDLGNVLELLPINARPPSRARRVWRFVRRKPALSAAVVLGFLGLVVAPTALYIQQRLHTDALEHSLAAEREARTDADSALGYLLGLFRANAPEHAHGKELTAHEVLDLGIEHLNEISKRPAMQAVILKNVGDVYNELAQYAKAGALFERALAIYDTLGLGGSREAARAKAAWATARWKSGALAEAERLLREAIALERALSDTESGELAPLENDLASILITAGRLDAAEPVMRESIALYAATSNADPNDVDAAHDNLASLLIAQKQYAAARDELQAILARQRQRLMAPDPRLAVTLNALGTALKPLGDFDGAQAAYTEALEMQIALVGEKSDSVAIGYFNLGRLKAARGDFDGARESLAKSKAILVEIFGAEYPLIASVSQELALIDHVHPPTAKH